MEEGLEDALLLIFGLPAMLGLSVQDAAAALSAASRKVAILDRENLGKLGLTSLLNMADSTQAHT